MRLFNLLFVLVALLFCNAIATQPNFTNASNQLFYQNTSSGAPIGCADMNGDGLDDIVHIYRTSDSVRIQFQQPGQNFIGLEVAGSVSNPWSLALADANGDGLNDIFLGPNNNPEVLISTGVPGAYVKTQLSQDVFSQGANFSDIDVDGDLDIFVCHDVGLSTPYRNDGNGNFTYDLSLIAAFTNGDSDNSGNYATVWTDYDNDGDQDMYLSRCRLGVGNPLDPRRINSLYQNDGNGNFTDVAEAAGLMPLAQSWSTDFADLDNDGDLDCIMLNHDQTSRIYEQTSPGIFTDRTTEAQLNQNNVALGIQVMVEDFDNDGWQDLILTGTNSDLFMQNLGDFTFSYHENLITGGSEPMHTGAIGDLNNDGLLDLIVGRGSGYNGSSSSNPDILLLNENNNENHFLKIRLEGEHSNRNGIGSRLEVYGDWGIQIREVRAGESYGISHSLTKHFGLGEATEIDSLVVRWPDGDRYVFQGLSVDNTYLIPERPQEVILTNIEAMLCEGDTLFAYGQAFTEADVYELGPFLSDVDMLEFVSLNITVFEISATLLATQICTGENYIAQDGTEFFTPEESFTHQSVLTDQNGCDSIIDETITVLPTFTNTLETSICLGEDYTTQDGTVFPGPEEIFTYQSILTDQNGCDSIIDETITVLPTFTSTLEISICLGEDHLAQDGTVFPGPEEGFIYQSVLTAENGCDSIIEEAITVLPVFNQDLELTLCPGQDYVASDGTLYPLITASFTHLSTLTTVDGCDSLINETINVLPTSQMTILDTICNGSDFLAPDGTLFEEVDDPFDHINVFTDVNGCDSIVVSRVSIYDILISDVVIFACPFSTIILGDGSSLELEDESLQVSYTIIDQNGCEGGEVADIIVTPFEFIIDELPTSLLYSGVNEVVQWLDCDAGFSPIEGATDVEFFPSENGNYAVILSRGECIDTSDCVNFIINSIKEPDWAGELKIYPNPTSGLLYLEQPVKVQGLNLNLSVTDLLGREVPAAVFAVDGRRSRIELPQTAGVYLLKITDEAGRSTVRRVVVK